MSPLIFSIVFYFLFHWFLLWSLLFTFFLPWVQLSLLFYFYFLSFLRQKVRSLIWDLYSFFQSKYLYYKFPSNYCFTTLSKQWAGEITGLISFVSCFSKIAVFAQCTGSWKLFVHIFLSLYLWFFQVRGQIWSTFLYLVQKQKYFCLIFNLWSFFFNTSAF